MTHIAGHSTAGISAGGTVLNAGLKSVFQPIGLAADINHVSMMQQPVEQSRGDHGIAEQLAPVAEILVCWSG